MFNRIRAYFAHELDHVENLPTSDVSWSDSEAFSGKDFPKYNPESLHAWKGHKIYSDMMRDEQVKAVVRFRRDSITGRDWFFTFCPEKAEQLGEDEVAKRISVFEHAVKTMRGTFSARLNGIMSAMTHGFSLTEKVYQTFEWKGVTWWGIKHLRTKPYHTFEFYVDEYGNLESIEQRTSGAIIDIDPDRMIHFVQNPDVDEQFGESELNAAYRSYYAKDVVIKLQSIYLERYAGGFLVAQPRPGSGKNVRRGTPEFGELTELLKSLQTKTAVFVPEWLMLEHHQPGSTDAFDRAIAQHDKSIAKALLVPNLLGISEQGNTGSYGQSQTQLEAFLWMLEADAKRLEEALNEQLFTELGDANFGDGLYPEFQFRQLSNAMIAQILSTWNALAQSGAVERTDADEAYVRDLLGFPAKPKNEDEGSEQVRPDTALNGAQIDALLKIAEQVAAGSLSKESAIEIIIGAFPIGIEKAQAIVNGQDSIQPPAEEDPNPVMADPEEEEPEMSSDEHHDEMHEDSTIAGEEMLTIEQKRFNRAMRRVDFAAIDNSAKIVEWEGQDRLTAAMDSMVEYAEESIRERGELAEDPEAVEEFRMRPSDVKAVKNALLKTLGSGWEIGELHAKREIRKSGFNRKASFADIGQIASQYLAARAASSAGKIATDISTMTDNIMLNSIKFGWSVDRTIDELYKVAVSQGFISEDLARAKKAEIAADAVTNHRAAVVVRTLQFEAINEARKATFNDPSLGGFVTAMEYSAILDSRTTEICTQLDGHQHGKNSEFWETYAPPNHFQCRSLLIPITQDDEWEETDTPVSAQPQVGFERFKPEEKEPPAPVFNINVPAEAFKVEVKQQEPAPAKPKTKRIDIEIGGKRVQGVISEEGDE